jgi:hypothetical protein
VGARKKTSGMDSIIFLFFGQDLQDFQDLSLFFVSGNRKRKKYL